MRELRHAVDAPRAGLESVAVKALFVAGVVVQLLPIIALDVFVTVDGPVHLAHSTALWDHLLGRSELLERYATLELLPATNLIPEVPLGLLAILLGPALAGKVVAGLYVVAFPLAVAWAVRGVAPDRWWLASLAIPMTMSFGVIFGFLNYIYGLLGFVLVTGHISRHRTGWDRRAVVVLGVLLTATYAAHVLPFALALVLLALVTMVDWRGRGLADLLTRIRPLALAAAPGLGLAVALVRLGLAADDTFSVSDLSAREGSLPATVAGLVSMATGLALFDFREVVFTAALSAFLALLTAAAMVRRLRRLEIRQEDAYLAFGLVLVAAYVLLDDGASLASGGGFLRPRLAVVPVLALLLWLAPVSPVRGRLAGATALLSLAVVAALTGIRWPWHEELSDRAAATVDVAPCLVREATIVQANLAQAGSSPLGRVTPFRGESGRLAALTDGWDLANLGFGIPYFPVRNRVDMDPNRHLAHDGTRLRSIPPYLDPLGYATRTGGQVDYIAVFGRAAADATTLIDPGWRETVAQLAAHYRRVAVSTDGWLEVYERSGLAARGEAQRRSAPGPCVRSSA